MIFLVFKNFLATYKWNLLKGTTLLEIDCDNALAGIIDDILIQILKPSTIQLRTTNQGILFYG
jgi:hypothetical protein